MRQRITIAIVLVTALAAAGAQAQTDGKYPDLKGQWTNAATGQGDQWDPTKPPGKAQQPPLTPEYQSVWDATLAKRAAGWIDAPCTPPGMPRAMIATEPVEFIVIPNTTYVVLSMSEFRRIYTDGRKWPDNLEPAYVGYSIGKWIDEDGDGRYDVLEVETRGLKAGRTFDSSDIPMHEDGETVIKERIYLDKADADLLHDEVTTTDHALTQAWTVTRSYRRQRQGTWPEHVCAENDNHVVLDGDIYAVSAEGYLTPTRKDQPPPDLQYFKPSQK